MSTSTDVTPTSARLRYRVLREDDLEAFHQLVIDPHIKRYLMDGETMERDWTRAAIASSLALFDQHRVGLWLVYEPEGAAPIGFCGFFVFEELGPEPQLLYALREAATGRGYATEMATALVAYAREYTELRELVAGVDEPNHASTRVLEKVGFRPDGERPGPFGRTLMFRLS